MNAHRARRAVGVLPNYRINWNVHELWQVECDPSLVNELAVEMDVSPVAVLCAYATLAEHTAAVPAHD